MSQQLKDRTKAFGIRVIKMVREIKAGTATSVGANYRSALRGRSKADFISRITIAEEEADETCYWLEIMIEMEIFPKSRLGPLLQEAKEITAILTTAGRTAKEKVKKSSIYFRFSTFDFLPWTDKE